MLKWWMIRLLASWVVLVSKVVLAPKFVLATKVVLGQVWFPRKIGMVPPIGIVGVTKLSIVVHDVCLFRASPIHSTSFRIAFVGDIGKNLAKNFCTRMSDEVMTLAGREFNQAFALSFNEKGKRRSRIESSVKF